MTKFSIINLIIFIIALFLSNNLIAEETILPKPQPKIEELPKKEIILPKTQPEDGKLQKEETSQIDSKTKIDEKLLNNQKKHNLLESYEDGYNYNWLAGQLGISEIVYGDYKVYTRKIDILNNLTNEEIKRVVKKYLHSSNLVSYTLTANEKIWFTPIVSFFANQIVFRFVDIMH